MSKSEKIVNTIEYQEDMISKYGCNDNGYRGRSIEQIWLNEASDLMMKYLPTQFRRCWFSIARA